MLFQLGQTCITKGVNQLIENENISYDDVTSMIRKHVTGDFGELCEEDKEINLQAIKDGDRILSKYKIKENSFYVITEWNRSVTTVLLCDEY